MPTGLPGQLLAPSQDEILEILENVEEEKMGEEAVCPACQHQVFQAEAVIAGDFHLVLLLFAPAPPNICTWST